MLCEAMSDASEADLKSAVASLYRTFLQREPDDQSMLVYVDLLRQFGGIAGIGQLASVFEQSTERVFRDFMPSCVRQISMNHGSADELNGKTIISLGTHCAPSMLLKKNHLKQFSGPFDWIFSNLAMVRHCLEDGFATYLNPEFHERELRLNLTGELEATSHHLYYETTLSTPAPVFNHRDITDPKHQTYYQRCADLFMSMVRSGDEAYLLHCAYAGVYSLDDYIEEFRTTARLLNELAPGTSLVMFYLSLKGGIIPEVAVLDELGPHRLFRMDTVSVLGALHFHELIDEITLLRALRWHVRTRPSANVHAPATPALLVAEHKPVLPASLPGLPETLQGFLDELGSVEHVACYEVTPHNFVLGQGAEIVTEAIAFHNTSGGALVFGTTDLEFREAVQNQAFNAEIFCWVVENWTGHRLAIQTATYPHPSGQDATIEVVVVPPRNGAPLLRLNQGFAGFPAGEVLVRAEDGVAAATARHFSLLCDNPGDIFLANPLKIGGFPPRPADPWELIGRDKVMIDLLQWFCQAGSVRAFLEGPDGVGKTAAAAEFGRRLAQSGQGLLLPGGQRLDHVIFLGHDDPGFEAWAEGHYELRADPVAARFAHILYLIDGLAGVDSIVKTDWLSARLQQFFSKSNGLIIVDDGRAADESLLIRVLSTQGHNRLLYTTGKPSRAMVDFAFTVSGFTLDSEFAAFLGQCAARLEVEPPGPADHLAIAQCTGGLPRYVEAVVAHRRDVPDYAQALSRFRRRLVD